jgi:hypothetical protein
MVMKPSPRDVRDVANRDDTFDQAFVNPRNGAERARRVLIPRVTARLAGEKA